MIIISQLLYRVSSSYYDKYRRKRGCMLKFPLQMLSLKICRRPFNHTSSVKCTQSIHFSSHLINGKNWRNQDIYNIGMAFKGNIFVQSQILFKIWLSKSTCHGSVPWLYHKTTFSCKGNGPVKCKLIKGKIT
jgi:hypothetical protein